MLRNTPEMPQHLLIALDRHEQLLEEARRYRQAKAARQSVPPRHRWRWLRLRLGEFLIVMGQRLKADTAWG
jgi:hypothetical protein